MGSHLIKRPDSHRRCMVCGDVSGLKLEFYRVSSGVQCKLKVNPAWQGYAGTLHGGMICTLLDAAMTHCLFSQGQEAVTADLQVRFLHPVPVPCTEDLCLQAEVVRYRLGTFWLNARLTHADLAQPAFATAQGRFMPRSRKPNQ